MGFLSSLFGGGKNPANVAMPYLNQIDPMAKENLQPWQQQGQQAQQTNQGQYNKMALEPGGFLDELGKSYTTSKGYENKYNKAMSVAQNAAAAGGYAGTGANVEAQARLAKDLLGEDYESYIDRLLGVQQTGLQGNENIAGRGFQAAGDLTNILGTNASQKAGLAYKGQQSQNDQNAQLRKMVMQGIGAALGSFGGRAGMPAGSSLGGQLAGGSSGNSGGWQPSNTQIFGQALYGMGK